MENLIIQLNEVLNYSFYGIGIAFILSIGITIYQMSKNNLSNL